MKSATCPGQQGIFSMYKTVLAAKIHGIHVLETRLYYDGSCGIPFWIMDKVGLHNHEQVHIYNENNGERIITYAIPTDEDRAGVTLLGPAARKGMAGDKLIIAVYRNVELDIDIEPAVWKP